MKRIASVFLVTFVLSILAGATFAAEMSGEVTAVNEAKGTFTLKNGDSTADFACEPASLINETKVTDKVSVQYRDANGKKIAVKIKLQKKEVSVGC